MAPLSRAQIDRLGDRLRAARLISAEDRILLDGYRRSLTSFSHAVTQRLQQLFDSPITERPGKTTPSIIAKLRRQAIALSRVQDMAGGRVVVADLTAQNSAIAKVLETYPDARIIDRREAPIVGYHAAHLVIRIEAQSYEFQIRTEAQQRWAQLSEKFADLVGFEIKYGGGSQTLSELLTGSGELIYLIEQLKVVQRELLKLHEEAQEIPNYETGIDRERVIANLAKADADLEKSFSAREHVIELLRQGR